MTISYKTTTANSILDNSYDTLLGASPVLQVRSGAAAGPDNAAGGTLGVAQTLPATAFAAAVSKSKAKTGTWSGTAAASITGAHYRLQTSGGTAFEEGTVTATGGGGDMTLDNTSIASSQVVTTNTFTKTLP
jgi:hypothetical protein